jgi:hypothetical protein
MATSSWRDGTREMTGRPPLLAQAHAKSGWRWNGRLGLLLYLSADLELFARHDFKQGSVGRARIEASTLLRSGPLPCPPISGSRRLMPSSGALCLRENKGAGPWERARALTSCCYRRRLAAAPQHPRRSGSMLVRGAGSSGKRRAIPAHDRRRRLRRSVHGGPRFPSQMNQAPRKVTRCAVVSPPGKHRAEPERAGPCR